ncbi:hypothetical protein CSOJ01_05503 [Colletotrichum sojae]|uniref:Uncharacterized protein n=1 Tax=Colletotrichum sojae TaxID=2175907 RepID=A0A8H6MXE7_9PEZI|nr:hypothetical protein CSOJ01_05503 [Colletotrichum sojae]
MGFSTQTSLKSDKVRPSTSQDPGVAVHLAGQRQDHLNSEQRLQSALETPVQEADQAMHMKQDEYEELYHTEHTHNGRERDTYQTRKLRFEREDEAPEGDISSRPLQILA